MNDEGRGPYIKTIYRNYQRKERKKSEDTTIEDKQDRCYRVGRERTR